MVTAISVNPTSVMVLVTNALAGMLTLAALAVAVTSCGAVSTGCTATVTLFAGPLAAISPSEQTTVRCGEPGVNRQPPLRAGEMGSSPEGMVEVTITLLAVTPL